MPRYLLLTKHGVDSIGAGPMSEWDPDDITAHLEFLRALNQELIDNGELVDLQALTGPELAKIVTFDGQTLGYRSSAGIRCKDTWPPVNGGNVPPRPPQPARRSASAFE